MGILTYSPLGRRLAVGQLERRQLARPRRPASGWPRASTCRCPRTSASSKPSSSSPQVADDAGVSLIELAIAFVVNHPAVTSAIIGPRTMEQLDSQLPAADVALDAAMLDRIDEIVKPGVNLNPADTSYGEQVLAARPAAALAARSLMQITRSSIDTQKGPADWFTGDVYIDAVAAPAGTSTFAAALVHFTPGARTAWHTHPHGQTIFVTEGVGLCQREGGPIEDDPARRPRLLRARREPLARRRAEPLHGPHRHAAERRVRQPGHLGRARHRRAVRRRAARLMRRVPRWPAFKERDGLATAGEARRRSPGQARCRGTRRGR